MKKKNLRNLVRMLLRAPPPLPLPLNLTLGIHGLTGFGRFGETSRKSTGSHGLVWTGYTVSDGLEKSEDNQPYSPLVARVELRPREVHDAESSAMEVDVQRKLLPLILRSAGGVHGHQPPHALPAAGGAADDD